MLLKDCYSIEPPNERMEAFWASVSERLDESPEAAPTPGGGSMGTDEAIVFESTAAMQILDIPEPPPEPVAPVADAAESEGAVAAPPPVGSPWRWPVALIFSTAIVVVGILAYKKMNPPQQPTYMASAAGGEERGRPLPGAPGHPGEAPGEQPAAAPAPGEPPADEAKGDEAKSDDEAAPTDEAKAEPGAEPKAEPGAEPTAEPGKEDGKPRARAVKRKRRARKGPAKEPAAARPATAAKPARKPAAKPKKKPAGDDLDSLIDGVIGKEKAAAKKRKAAKVKAAPLATAGLPEKLSEGQIRNGMKKIMGRVQACYDKYQVEGNARVKLSIAPTGKPAGVSIKGKFFGTDTGSCVVKAVKKARFPKFSGKPMTIRYPFLLQ